MAQRPTDPKYLQVQHHAPRVPPIRGMAAKRKNSDVDMTEETRNLPAQHDPPEAVDLQRRLNRPAMTAAARRILAEGASRKSLNIDPNIPLDSVLRLIPTAAEEIAARDRNRLLPPAPVPTPEIFKKKSTELRKLRRDKVWRTGTLDEKVSQMEEWFPDVANRAKLPSHSTWQQKALAYVNERACAVKATTSRTTPTKSDCPLSEIGTFGKLPGELRNRIYRLAVLEATPIEVTMESHSCGYGPCKHRGVAYNVPGIAQTCRQMRWEVMPIFCVENVAFEFDDEVVKERCAAHFLDSIGDYASDIADFRFLLKRPIWSQDDFLHYATYTFTLLAPDISMSQSFELTHAEPQGRRICQCTLDEVVAGLNARKHKEPSGKLVLEFANSDELCDFVWCMRKSKQRVQHLAVCKRCKEVVFNN